MPTNAYAPLSDQVRKLENDVRILAASVIKTIETVQLFVDCYDAPNHEHTMPKNRDVHTKDLKKLLEFIKPK